uniref:CRAL-TRIO domain-containing protein n=2 Tax=Schistocephalus solidus TaxID=70667 RepID=A0A0X3PV53_SCHSO
MDGLSLEESISDSDRLLISEFRRRVCDIHYQLLGYDVYVFRWLKARNFDIDRAEKMFRSHYEWKVSLKIDDLLDNFVPPEVVQKYFPCGLCGHDKRGRPILYCPAGTTDVFGLMKSAPRAQLINSQFYLMESIIHRHFPAAAAAAGRPVDQLVVIFDLQHMNRRQLWRPWLSLVQELTTTFELNYPEVMAVSFVINAPAFFSLVFSLLKPLLSKETQEKVHVLSSNYTEELLKLIDADNLPMCYGGTMTDLNGDPKCSSRICWGGPVPESYYLTQPARQADGSPLEADLDDSYVLVPIGRGGKEYLFMGEARPGDLLCWEFFTESNDIAFSLWVNPVENGTTCVHTAKVAPNIEESSASLCADRSASRRLKHPESETFMSPAQDLRGWLKNGALRLNAQKSTDNTEKSNFVTSALQASLGGSGSLPKSWQQVTQPVRVDSDLVPEQGEWKVDRLGTYYLLFDNTYSWTRNKRVWCRVETRRAEQSALVNGHRERKEGRRPSCALSILEQCAAAAEIPRTLAMPNPEDVSLASEQLESMTEEETMVADAEVDETIREALRELTQPPTMDGYRCRYTDSLDVDLSALLMVLVQALPLIRRLRPRHKQRTR